MGFDKGRRGKRRDKRDGFGDDSFDSFPSEMAPPVERFIRDDDRGTPRSGGFRGGSGGGGGMPPQVVGEGTGKVKFFNGQKGFGFIVQDGGGDDVFVHISAVERAGLSGLAEGQGLKYSLVDRGGKVSATDLEVDGELLPVAAGNSAPPRDSHRDGPPRDRFRDGPRDGGRDGGRDFGDRDRKPMREATGEKATGTVKFFNGSKGFGFIERDDGQPDAFVHISAVERAGMSGLNEGDKLEFELEVDRRGKYSAVNLVSRG